MSYALKQRYVFFFYKKSSGAIIALLLSALLFALMETLSISTIIFAQQMLNPH